MKYNLLGKTGLTVSRLSFGASSLGGVFHPVDESEAIRSVHGALDLGINYFDVAPAYGGTRAETVLGKALKGIPRDRYYLSTKVGKFTKPGGYGDDTLDYSRARIRASLGESSRRLGTDYFDLVHLHDFEYQQRQHTEWALAEGVAALLELKKEGRIGNVSFGIYPMDAHDVGRLVAVQRGADGHGGARHEQRVAVGRALRDDGVADVAAGAGPVVDHYRLAPALRERQRHDAADDVAAASGREGHHHPHRRAAGRRHARPRGELRTQDGIDWLVFVISAVKKETQNIGLAEVAVFAAP